MVITSDSMPQQLLWVGDAETHNQFIGSSARQKQARIRRHVQIHRREHATAVGCETSLISGQTRDLQKPDCVKGVPASSLRPTRSLGRLASKPTNCDSKCKRQKVNKHHQPIDATSSGVRLPLKSALPFLGHGLSSSERASLAVFQHRTCQEWSGWADAHFWNSLALQVSQQSQVVARSLVAISALHEQMGAIGSVERARLQRLSYEQSGKATKALLARSELSYFEALVSCLIMICFHGIQHRQAPFVLLRSGLKLLAESKGPGRASSEERRLVELQVRPLFSRVLARPCSMVDMCKAFTISVENHMAKAINVPVEKPWIPQTFGTLSEARDCLQDILDWAHDNFLLEPLPKNSIVIFLDEVHKLRDAWQTSMAGSQLPKTPHSIKSQKLLRASCLVSMIIIATARCTEETAWDRYEADFQEILSLVEGAWSSGHSFGIDAGLFDITAFVGSKCRDPHIRRSALRLLKSRSRMEGERLAANPATILEALIALEERDLEVATCHDIPERSRRRLISGQQYVSQGRIDLFFASSNGVQKERCCVSLTGVNAGRPSKNFDHEANVADAVFGIGYAAYLEERETRSYFRFEMDRFFFPIPKV